MSAAGDAFVALAMQTLPEDERRDVGRRLLEADVDAPDEVIGEAWTATWRAEIERRLAAIRDGSAESVDADDVLRADVAWLESLPVMRARFLVEAEAENQEARARFAAYSRAAAARWVGHVHSLISSIRSQPYVWPVYPGLDGVHVRVLGRYPYSLIYTVTPPTIWIIAVAYQGRDPGYWTSRLK